MTATLLVICLGGVAFLIRFFIALCQEGSRCKGAVVGKLSFSPGTHIEVEEWPAIGSSRPIPRRRQPVHGQRSAERAQQQPATDYPYKRRA